MTNGLTTHQRTIDALIGHQIWALSDPYRAFIAQVVQYYQQH